MSEEALARIEHQLSQLMPIVPIVTATQQDIIEIKGRVTILEQNSAETTRRIAVIEQNSTATREDLNILRDRHNSLEGGILVALRDGFDSVKSYMDDLNYADEENARKTRSVSRRVRRLERLNEDDD